MKRAPTDWKRKYQTLAAHARTLPGGDARFGGTPEGLVLAAAYRVAGRDLDLAIHIGLGRTPIPEAA